MQERSTARWERLQKKGKWNFILKFGALGWGVPTAVIFAAVFPWVMPGWHKLSFWTVLPLGLVLFPLGGIAWAHHMWNFFEKAYQKAKTSEKGAAQDSDHLHR